MFALYDMEGSSTVLYYYHGSQFKRNDNMEFGGASISLVLFFLNNVMLGRSKNDFAWMKYILKLQVLLFFF